MSILSLEAASKRRVRLTAAALAAALSAAAALTLSACTSKPAEPAAQTTAQAAHAPARPDTAASAGDRKKIPSPVPRAASSAL